MRKDSNFYFYHCVFDLVVCDSEHLFSADTVEGQVQVVRLKISHIYTDKTFQLSDVNGLLLSWLVATCDTLQIWFLSDRAFCGREITRWVSSLD